MDDSSLAGERVRLMRNEGQADARLHCKSSGPAVIRGAILLGADEWRPIHVQTIGS
jgi:hypothetical protein